MTTAKPAKILIKIDGGETIKVSNSRCDISFYERLIHIKPNKITVKLEEIKHGV